MMGHGYCCDCLYSQNNSCNCGCHSRSGKYSQTEHVELIQFAEAIKRSKEILEKMITYKKCDSCPDSKCEDCCKQTNGENMKNKWSSSAWPSTLTKQQEDEVNKFYEEEMKPMFDDGCEGCDDCDSGAEHEVKNLAPGFDVRVHKKLVKPKCPCCDDKNCTNTSDNCEKCDSMQQASNHPWYTGHPSIDEFLHDTLEVMRKKGHDYRQGNDTDLLHNFRKVAEAVDEPMMKVWFTYFYKHYAALTTYIKNDGQSESEPIESRITDMIVYLLLFHEMVRKNGRAEHGVIE